METVNLVIYAVIALVGFVVLYRMARTRGRNPIGWGIFGAIALVIALVAILIVGRKEARAV